MKKGDFHVELNEDNFNLLVQSVSELSSVIGENQIETKSISLLFLQMNYGMHSFEKFLLHSQDMYRMNHLLKLSMVI